MSYEDLLDKETSDTQFLIVMHPRRKVTGTWTLVSGFMYTQPFDYGHVTAVEIDGEAVLVNSTSIVSNNEFFYDFEAQLLYINVGSNPNSFTTEAVVVTYELYFGTFDANFHRDPLDDSTRVVYYEPLISKSPSVTTSSSETFFGFMPTFRTTVGISNATKYLQRHIYDSSFNLAPIEVYHYIDELTVGNVKLLTKGFTKEIESTDREINFAMLDPNSYLETEYRNQTGNSFFSTDEFPNIDSQYIGRCIRKVYGVVDGFVPVNIDYQNSEPTTSDNRQYVVAGDYQNLGTISTVVSASPASTATTTYVNSTDGLNVGDNIYDSTAGLYATITAVSAGIYVEHTSWAGASPGDTIVRPAVASIKISQNSVIYTALYNRDYTVFADVTNRVFGFTFETSLEANLSMPLTLTPTDTIWCRVYGPKNTVVMDGDPFGSNSSTIGNLSHPIVILYDLLKNALGLVNSEINLTNFLALESSITDDIGFAIPEQASQDFPQYKELILNICQTLLGKFYKDFDHKWAVSLLAPVTSADKTINDEEILDRSWSYTFDYSDVLSDVIVRYRSREIDETGRVGNDTGFFLSRESVVAKYLHKISRQRTFKSLHVLSNDVQVLIEHLKYYFGERRGIVTLKTKNRFFDTELSDSIEVSRARLPGYEFSEGIEHTRNLAILATDKSLNDVKITADDQKGVEDAEAEGEW